MAQYALPPEPSWDETIVPALRKRTLHYTLNDCNVMTNSCSGLEIESRLLSKRLSVHSITSTEDSISAYYFNGANSADLDNRSRTGNGATGVQDNHTRHKPSAIPRPSLQYSQDASDEQADVVGHTETMSAKPSFSRSRTYSQPYPFQADHHAPSSHNFHDSTLPTPNSSRSNSPMALNSNIRPLDVKPTRIPKVSQPRSGNSISHGHGVPPAGGRHLTKNGSVESHPLYHVNGEMPTDPRLVNGSGVSTSSTQFTRPSSRSQDRNASGILNEQAPFVPTSIAASFADDEAQSRASTDEERPFEHWYRGDVARNGGVGEVRVASRKEMLDIANYGHKFRAQASRGAAVGGVAAFARGPRKRADSTGARESLYIDDAAARTVGDMVLDETPLTDLEADTETDRETGYTTPRETPQRASSRQHTRAAPTTSGATTALPRPSPSHARSEYVRGMSEPPELLSARLRMAPTTRGLPQSQSMSSAQNIPKRGRTKSTTTKSPGPASKKVNGLTAQQKRSKSNFDGKRAERSSEYPEPPDFPEGMADAIPSWTQPKMKAGNWDDVRASLLNHPLAN